MALQVNNSEDVDPKPYYFRYFHAPNGPTGGLLAE